MISFGLNFDVLRDLGHNKKGTEKKELNGSKRHKI